MKNSKASKIIQQAKRIANAKGFAREAEDFSQDAIVRILNGRMARLDYLLVDYLRENYSRTHFSKNHKRKKPIDQVYYTREVKEGDCVEVEPEQFQLNFNEILKHLNQWREDKEGRIRCMLVLRYLWGLNEKEIGYCFNVSESRVSQLTHLAFSYLKEKFKKS